MMVQAQQEEGKGSTMPTDPQHTPTITQPLSSQPHKKQISRKSKKQNTEVPQLSGFTDDAADENVPTHSNDPLLNTTGKEEIESFKKECHELERKRGQELPVLKRLRKVGRSARIESSKDEGLGDLEDASKQERKIADIKTLIEIKAAKPKVRGVMIQEPSESTTTTPAASKPSQDKAELEEEERLARQKEEEANIALIESWDNTQAMMDAHYQMA
ncbi:hypothetical protein Tco_0611276 [Tanacetum coccineum]